MRFILNLIFFGGWSFAFKNVFVSIFDPDVSAANALKSLLDGTYSQTAANMLTASQVAQVELHPAAIPYNDVETAILGPEFIEPDTFSLFALVDRDLDGDGIVADLRAWAAANGYGGNASGDRLAEILRYVTTTVPA